MKTFPLLTVLLLAAASSLVAKSERPIRIKTSADLTVWYADYTMNWLSLEETKELKAASEVYVEPSALMRPTAPFREKVSEGEALADVLTRIFPRLERGLWKHTLMVAVIKQDSAERVFINAAYSKLPFTPEMCRNITVSPGDVLWIGLRDI